MQRPFLVCSSGELRIRQRRKRRRRLGRRRLAEIEQERRKALSLKLFVVGHRANSFLVLNATAFYHSNKTSRHLNSPNLRFLMEVGYVAWVRSGCLYEVT